MKTTDNKKSPPSRCARGRKDGRGRTLLVGPPPTNRFAIRWFSGGRRRRYGCGLFVQSNRRLAGSTIDATTSELLDVGISSLTTLQRFPSDCPASLPVASRDMAGDLLARLLAEGKFALWTPLQGLHLNLQFPV